MKEILSPKGKRRFLVLAAMILILYAWPVIAATPAQPAALLNEVIKGARAEGELNLVMGAGLLIGPEGTKVLEEPFNKKYGLTMKLNYVPGPASPQMTSRVIQEAKAGAKASSDLMVVSAGDTRPIKEANLAGSVQWRQLFPSIPEKAIQVKGQVVEFLTEYPGVAYNTQLVRKEEVPRRIMDLLAPKWKGKIASTPYAASFDRIADPKMLGYQKAKEFTVMFAKQIGGLIGCTEPERIASGEFLMLAFSCGDKQIVAFRESKGAPVDAALLEDAIHMMHYYLVVPKNSEHPNLAILFVSFLLSREGQEALYRGIRADYHGIQGTYTGKVYADFKARGLNIVDFTADYELEKPEFAKWKEEFRNLLLRR